MKKIFFITFITATFMYYSYGQYGDLDSIKIARLDSINPLCSKVICDVSEMRIYCGESAGDKHSNIILYDTNACSILKGEVTGVLYFDNIDSLKIIDFDLRGLRLKDSVTNAILFNYSRYEVNSTEDLSELIFYESKILPIIKNFKCWSENPNMRQFYNRIMFFCPFTVKPIEK